MRRFEKLPSGLIVPKLTRRQVMRAGLAMGLSLGTTKARAAWLMNPYRFGSPLTMTGATSLAMGETAYLAIDFTDLSMSIKDPGTPANDFDGDPNSKLTYTSPSSKFIQNASGVMVSGSTLRTHYEGGVAVGLWIEGSRTNVLLRSEEFDNAAWGKTNVTVTANDTAAPDGTTTADLLTSSAANGFVNQSAAISAQSTAMFEVWLKRKTGTGTINIECGQNTLVCALSAVDWSRFNLTSPIVSGATYDRTSNVVTVLATAHNLLAGDQVRLVASSGGLATNNFTVATAAANSFTVSNVGADIAAGNTMTFYPRVCRIKLATSGDAIWAWGAQYENGDGRSSYIATTSATVTRAIDQITIATSLFPFSATNSTLVARSYVFVIPGSPRWAAQLDDGTANERFALGYNQSAAARLEVTDGGVSQAGFTSGTIVTESWSYQAGRYALNDFALVEDANAGNTDISGTMPSPTLLRIGASTVASTNSLHGFLSHLLYVPRSLTTVEMQARTRP